MANDGTEICSTCNQRVKIADCYGHLLTCEELCTQCKERPALCENGHRTPMDDSGLCTRCGQTIGA